MIFRIFNIPCNWSAQRTPGEIREYKVWQLKIVGGPSGSLESTERPSGGLEFCRHYHVAF